MKTIICRLPDSLYSPAVEILGDIAASLNGLTDLVSPLVRAPEVERFLSELASSEHSESTTYTSTLRIQFIPSE